MKSLFIIFIICSLAKCFGQTNDEQYIWLTQEITKEWESADDWDTDECKAYIEYAFSGLTVGPALGNNDPRVTSGKFVPETLRHITAENFLTDDVTQLGDDRNEQLRNFRIITITWKCLSTRNKEVRAAYIDVASKHKDFLPLTSGHVWLYKGMDIAMSEHPYQAVVMPISTWRDLGISKNPVYRIFAIKGISESTLPQYEKFLTGSSQDPRVKYWSALKRLEALEVFLMEEDPFILKSLYGAMASCPHPDAITLLEAQYENPLVLNDTELKSAVTSTIESVRGKLSNEMYEIALTSNPEEATLFDFSKKLLLNNSD